MSKTKIKVKPKVKVETTTIFIRSVSSDAKKKFYDKAKMAGYQPREFFEQLMKAL
jgi:hypothetical protein